MWSGATGNAFTHGSVSHTKNGMTVLCLVSVQSFPLSLSFSSPALAITYQANLSERVLSQRAGIPGTTWDVSFKKTPQVVVGHTFKLYNWEAETGRSL